MATRRASMTVLRNGKAIGQVVGFGTTFKRAENSAKRLAREQFAGSVKPAKRKTSARKTKRRRSSNPRADIVGGPDFSETTTGGGSHRYKVTWVVSKNGRYVTKKKLFVRQSEAERFYARLNR